MTQPLPTFRVHYSITSLNGVERKSVDIPAATPAEAAALITTRHKPRPVAIGKIKRVKEKA